MVNWVLGVLGSIDTTSHNLLNSSIMLRLCKCVVVKDIHWFSQKRVWSMDGGDNRYGQSGGGRENKKPIKWKIKEKIMKIHCSFNQSFAIITERVYCCGYNNYYQMGSKLMKDEKPFKPTLLYNIENVEGIVTSETNTYFITNNGDIYFCVKYIKKGKSHYENKPLKISNLKGMTNVFASSSNYFLNCLKYGIISTSNHIYEIHRDKIKNTYKLRKKYKTFEEYIWKKHKICYKSIHINNSN